MRTLADVKGLGKIVEVYSDFSTELKELQKARARLITPRDEAYARIKTAGEVGRSYGTWTTAGVEYARKELPLLNLDSRLLDPKLAGLAVKANRNGNYFHTETRKEYEESLKQAEKDKDKKPSERRVIVLPSRETFAIKPSENFEVLEFLLKDQTKEYFELNGTTIDFSLVDEDTVDAQDGTLLTQLWFRSLDDGSRLYGYRGLGYGDDWARGVQESGEATQKVSAPKIKRPYQQDKLIE